MLSKNEWSFIVVTILFFVFVIMILLFISFTQYVKINSEDVTYREIEFIRYRYK